jgi:hypothetical protein
MRHTRLLIVLLLLTLFLAATCEANAAPPIRGARGIGPGFLFIPDTFSSYPTTPYYGNYAYPSYSQGYGAYGYLPVYEYVPASGYSYYPRNYWAYNHSQNWGNSGYLFYPPRPAPPATSNNTPESQGSLKSKDDLKSKDEK